MSIETTKQIEEILNSDFWIQEVEPNVGYFRTQDDNDGERTSGVSIIMGQDGDAHILTIPGPYESDCRYRTWGGGGRSLKVRNAIMILAYAIQLENNENPVDTQ